MHRCRIEGLEAECVLQMTGSSPWRGHRSGAEAPEQSPKSQSEPRQVAWDLKGTARVPSAVCFSPSHPRRMEWHHLTPTTILCCWPSHKAHSNTTLAVSEFRLSSVLSPRLLGPDLTQELSSLPTALHPAVCPITP